jgi:hypothetical protein
MREDEFDRVSRQGAAAWKSLKREKNWNDWLKVGEALRIWREWAQNQSRANRPIGKAYNMAFGEKLLEYKLDDMDKGTRSRLFDVMDNLPLIEEWRRTLPLTERLKLNHPNAVLRKWKAFMKPEPREEDGEPKPTLRDSVVNLSEENAALKAHIAELEAARDSTAVDPAAATFEQLKPRLIELLTSMRPDERRLALDGLAEPFADIATRISLADAEPAVATTAARASAKPKSKVKASSPRPKTSDALVWTDEREPEAPATNGVYEIAVLMLGGYTVRYRPDDPDPEEHIVQDIGEAKDVDEAKRMAQRHHDAGEDR